MERATPSDHPSSAGESAIHPANDGGTLAGTGFLALLSTQFLTALNDNIFRWLVIGLSKHLVPPGQVGNVLMAGTAAFVLPILQRLMKGPRGKLRVLILSPTRELSEQTHNAIGVLGRQTGFHSLTIYGGVSAQPQIKGLRAGAEIAVACPGRLLDLMQQHVVNLGAIEILVLDEAPGTRTIGTCPHFRRIDPGPAIPV